MNNRTFKSWIACLSPGLFFFSLLFGLEIIYGGYFPNSNGLVGHDFSYYHPMLLDGAFWFWQNGLLAVPWFTPSFCGGQPFFADTISIYYSLIQWLVFFVPPTTASHITLLISCSLGYWAFFFLARSVFCLSTGAAIAAGALAMLNGLTPHRMLVGEVGFQAFLLIAFVSHALLSTEEWSPWKKWRAGNSFWAGLTLAYMFQSGFSHLMIPAGLGVVAVACLARIARKGASLKIFIKRGVLAIAFAGAMCAARILAGLTFMSNFPRESYLLPGFESWTDALSFPVLSLIFDSQTVSTWANQKLANVQWQVFPHEWAYQFGLTYIGLILAGVCCLLFSGLSRAAAQPRLEWNASKRAPYLAILVLILLIPSALLWMNPQWNALLKTLPIIKTTSFPFRWIIIWIPVACTVGAMAWQAVESTTRNATLSAAGLAVFCLAMLIESGLADRKYYQATLIQDYNPQWIDQAWLKGKQGDIQPIAKLTSSKRDENGQWEYLPGNRNDYMTMGASFIPCYNPAYGYRLERLPVGRLRAGYPALEEQDGFLNIKKPACLIWPEENGCTTIGEEYKAHEINQAQLFLQRRPITFEVSTGQQLANYINVLALLIAAAGLFAYAINKIRQMHNFFKG